MDTLFEIAGLSQVMLKKNGEIGSIGSEAFMVYTFQNKNLEGELLTLVESFGFEKNREEAVKSIVRRTIWNYFLEMKYIPFELVEKINPPVELKSLGTKN